MKGKSHLTSYQQLIQQFQFSGKENINIKKNQNKNLKPLKNNQNVQNYQPSLNFPNFVKNISKSSQKLQKLQNKKLITQQSTQKSYFIDNKIKNQINQVLTQIIDLQGVELLNHKISYIQYLQTLKSLKIINQNYQPYPNDLVGQLWHEFISQNNVANFIYIIGQILNNSQNKLQCQHQVNSYLKQKFKDLKLKRNNSKENIQNLLISKNQTKKLSKNIKMTLSKTNQNLQSIQVEKVKKNLSFEKQAHLTSQNDTSQNNQWSSKTQRIFNSNSGQKRCEILYKLAKSKSANKKQAKLSIDIQYQKSIKQLTFKPKINSKNKSKQKIGNEKKVRGQAKVFQRMLKGRIQKQLKQAIRQKGNTYSQKIIERIRKQKYKHMINKDNNKQNQDKIQTITKNVDKKDVKEKHKQIIAVNIFIDKCRCEILTYCRGQQTINQAAQRFIKKFKLGNRQKQKLVKQLQSVIKFSLASIKQQQQQSLDAEFLIP